MHLIAPLLAVASVWIVAVLTPGPNFLATARISAARSRRQGLAVVGGIGVATAIWGFAGLAGIQALFLAAPWFYAGLKILGAGYLVVTGLRLSLASRGRHGDEDPKLLLGQALSTRAAFQIGLVTSLANPRSALSVASIFAATLPAHPSVLLGAAAIAVMVAISVTWYTAVAYLFTIGLLAAAYARLRRSIDRAAGVLLVWFGARLVFEPA